MRRTAADLIVCLAIQILVVTGIGGAAHSGTMATAERFSLCGTGGVIDAPDAGRDRHCMVCTVAVACVAADAPTVGAERVVIAEEIAQIAPDVAWIARPDALRIRAPPAWSQADI